MRWPFASTLIAATFSVAVVPVVAADMPRKVPLYKAPAAIPYVSWTGVYAGINAGYGWGRHDVDLVGFSPDLTQSVGINIPTAVRLEPKGGILGGAQAGYNWHNGLLLLGLEVDIQASAVRDSVSLFMPGTTIRGADPFVVMNFFPTLSLPEERLSWFGTVRPRVGLTPFERVLLYATGGLAYGRVQDTYTFIRFPPPGIVRPPFFPSLAETKIGWTAGAGGEYKVTNSLSFKIEYLYIDLGTSTINFGSDPSFPTTFLDYRFKHRENIVRAGLNWRLDSRTASISAKY
jgi:outer membrane immunogenic protein